MESSGWGWQHFGVRTVGTAGHLHALRTLDYEDEAQRRGFRFMVQVTDRVSGLDFGYGSGFLLLFIIIFIIISLLRVALDK